MSAEKKCCDIPSRKTPYEVRETGLFIVTEVQHDYYSEATAKCKQCGEIFRGMDHPGYHFNYWSWS